MKNTFFTRIKELKKKESFLEPISGNGRGFVLTRGEYDDEDKRKRAKEFSLCPFYISNVPIRSVR